MEYCLNCEKDTVSFGDVRINVGSKVFETKANRCVECGFFEKTPKLQKEIDAWGLSNSSSIMEFQPYFASDLIESVNALCERFNMKRTEFIKVCTAFYLSVLTQESNFKDLRKTALEKADKVFQGQKEKVNIQVKYNLFKKIDLFTRAWKLEYSSHVIEEAVRFCVLTIEDKLSQQSTKQRLMQDIQVSALAS